MRRIAGTISLFAVIEALGILISLGFSADANSNTTNGSCFTVSGSVITDYKVSDNCGSDVIIPSTINGTTIKEIGNNAFSNKGLTSINIPNSIEKIGSSAFSSNKLTDLILPNSVSEVGYGAFAWNEGIKQITLSENMETLPGSFCNGCNVRKLRNGIPNKMKKIGKAFNARSTYGNTTYLGWTFYDMEKMEIPSSVEEIADDAFGTITFSNFDIKSKNINIGTIYSINSNVKLNITKGATVKYSIKNIPGHWSSSFSDPTSVSIKSLEEDGAAVNFIVSGDLVVYQPIAVGFKKGDYAVYPKDIILTGYEIDGRYYEDEYYNYIDFDIENTPLTKDITLYAKLKELPCWEFTLTDEDNKEVEVKKYHIEYPYCINWYNENYQNFTIPSIVPNDLEYAGYKVTGIGDMAFCNAEYQNGMGIVERSFVSHITIPDGIRYIGAKSFKKSSLTSIVLPDSIEYIGEQAFFGNGLKNITWSENLKSIGSNAFAYSSLQSTKFPDSLKVIGSAAFHESQLSQIEFGSGSQLESIGYLAFGYSDPYNGPQYGNIKKVTFPKSLRSIENLAFYNNKVEEITLLCDSCTVYQNAFQIEGRNDRQIPGYKRRNANITNYDMHLILTDLVETYKITLDSDGATEKGTENLWYDLGTPIYYLDKEKKNTIDGGITIPTKEGYSFQGYFTEKNGNGLKYISNLGVIGKIYNIDSDTVLYASWKKDEEQDNTHNAASSDCNGLSNPKREGYKFIGWYTDKNYTKLYNPNELVTGELTLYSKWEEESNSRTPSFDDSDDSDDHQSTGLEIPEENYGEISAPKISGSIEYNGVKMGTITVSYGDESITILDRNLGATKAGTGKDSYGYYFQWGNNHGFTEKDNITHIYNDHTYKGYGPVNPLNSDLFGGTYFDIWYDSKHYDFLWGGEKDNKSNNYDAGNVKLIEDLTSRQGPCPKGFHIPSAGEWSKLLELWGYNNSIYNWKSDAPNLKELSNKGIGKKLSNDLLLPFAGTISVGSWGNVSMSQVGERSLLRTSSPLDPEDENDRKNLSRSMYIYEDELSLSIEDRSDAQNIRCFQDTTLKTISNYSIIFDTNGGEHINNIPVIPYSNQFTTAFMISGSNNNRYLTDLYEIEKYLIPVRTGYEFIGWYANKELTEKFDFDTILTKNIALYAKRSKKINQEKINGVDTITVYDSSSDKSITIMANNLGATSNKKIGYLYQRGNNYGFTEKQLETNKTITPIKYENYGPQKPYKSEKYVEPTSYTIDYWENNTHYPNLRGGQGDTQSNNRDASVEKSLRKGPCPDGFHVPSKGEWDDLINMWSKNNGITWTMSRYGGYPDKPAYYKITEDLNLRSGEYYKRLWTSSPVEGGKSYILGIANDYTVKTYSNPNNSPAQVRCFLDSAITNNTPSKSDEGENNNTIKYKVTVKKGAGVSAVKGDGEYKYGQNVSIRATPLAGYKIIGFDGDVKTGSFSMPAKNVNVIVKAEKDDTKYKISYDYNGGKLESGKVNPVTYTTNSQSFNLNPPVKNGFIFAGWQESINGRLVGTKTYVSIPKGSSGNRSYKAMWKKEGDIEEVVYNQQEDLNGEYNTVEVIPIDSNGRGGNNGGGNGSSNTPRNYVGFITPTDFSKQTASSNVNQGAVGEVLNLSDGVAIIIYKYKRDSFTLKIDHDKGIESVEGAGTYKYQQPVSIKVKVKSGYTFAGFEGEINVSDFEMPAKNLVIKATSTKK